MKMIRISDFNIHESHRYFFIFALSMALFSLHAMAKLSVITDTVCCSKFKVFTVWPLQKKFADLGIRKSLKVFAARSFYVMFLLW